MTWACPDCGGTDKAFHCDTILHINRFPPDCYKLPDREPWMESPEAFEKVWGRKPTPEQWAQFVKDWNTPRIPLDMR